MSDLALDILEAEIRDLLIKSKGEAENPRKNILSIILSFYLPV